MQFSRSRRKSGPGAVLSALRRMLVLGVLIFIALKANAPKRLRDLYQTWSSPSVTANDDQTENAAPEMSGPSVATSGDAGIVDIPDAQGLILMDGTDISDQNSGDAGTDPGATGTAASASGTEPQALDLDIDTQETPPGDIDKGLGAHQDVAEFLQSSTEDSVGQPKESGGASGGEDAEDPLETMMKEGDAIPGNGTAECPEGFPIKGNGRSGLYHVPEGLAYPRTKPDVCFRTPEVAEKAGFRRATG